MKTRKLYITMAILIIALLLVFFQFYNYGIKNASAEEIETTDEYIQSSVVVGDNLGGKTIFVDFANLPLECMDFTFVVTDSIRIYYTNISIPEQEIELLNTLSYIQNGEIYEIFNNENYEEFQSFTLPNGIGLVTEVSSEYPNVITILEPNPFYIPPTTEPEPTPTPTPDPTTPVDEIGGFLEGASAGAILLLIGGVVLLVFILKK